MLPRLRLVVGFVVASWLSGIACSQEQRAIIEPSLDVTGSPMIFRIAGRSDTFYGYFSLVVERDGSPTVTAWGSTRDLRYRFRMQFDPGALGLSLERTTDGALDVYFEASPGHEWVQHTVAQVSEADGIDSPAAMLLRSFHLFVDARGTVTFEARSVDPARVRWDEGTIAPGDDGEIQASGRISVACEAEETDAGQAYPLSPDGGVYMNDPPADASAVRENFCQSLLAGW